MYPVTVNLIPGLPQTPFRKGVGQYEGVVMHATGGNWEDTDTGNRNWEVTHWHDAFVHVFHDYDSSTEVASTDYVAWGAGGTANQRYLHSELCQSKLTERFTESYNRWITWAASKLFARGLGVIDGVTLLSHAQVSKLWGESDHTDPIDYLKYHGKTWANVVNDVAYLYACMAKWEADKSIVTYPLTDDDATAVNQVVFKFWTWADNKADKDDLYAQMIEVCKASGQVVGFTKMDEKVGNSIIWKISQFYGWSSTQEQKDEYHKLANLIRTASGIPLT